MGHWPSGAGHRPEHRPHPCRQPREPGCRSRPDAEGRRPLGWPWTAWGQHDEAHGALGTGSTTLLGRTRTIEERGRRLGRATRATGRWRIATTPQGTGLRYLSVTLTSLYPAAPIERSRGGIGLTGRTGTGQTSMPSSRSVTRAAMGDRSDRLRVTWAKSGWPLSFSMTAAIPSCRPTRRLSRWATSWVRTTLEFCPIRESTVRSTLRSRLWA